MAEELQQLIDRIQKEAVDRGAKEAEELVAGARRKAAAIVKEAEARSKALLEKAEKDAEAYTERSRKTLEQAARDLLITVGQGVENILGDLVAEAVDEAMTVEVIERLMTAMAEACVKQAGESRIDLLCSPRDKDELVKFLASRYRDKMIKGVELHVDREIVKGFKVSIVEGHVYHDFTREAIAEALTAFLRPELASLVHRVAKAQVEGQEKESKSPAEEDDGNTQSAGS